MGTFEITNGLECSASPNSRSGYFELTSTKLICDVGFAGDTVRDLVKLASVLPCPAGANEIVQQLVFARALQNGMFGCFVVTKLNVWCGE